jgi:hypothetical protein
MWASPSFFILGRARPPIFIAAEHRGAIKDLKSMSIPNTIIPGVRERLDVAPEAPPINVFHERGVGSNTASGGEVRTGDYTYREHAPPPAKPYRDLND